MTPTSLIPEPEDPTVPGAEEMSQREVTETATGSQFPFPEGIFDIKSSFGI